MGFGEEALQSLPGKVGSQVLGCFSFRFLNLLMQLFSKVSKKIKLWPYIFRGWILILVFRRQDVNDVLTAIDHVIDLGLASPSKIAVLGGSHGGFLTTHLIGQVH